LKKAMSKIQKAAAVVRRILVEKAQPWITAFRADIVIVFGVLFIACFLPYRWQVVVKQYALWLAFVVTLVVFWRKNNRTETQSPQTKGWGKALEILSTLSFLFVALQTIAQIKIEWVEPIRNASGVINITFDQPVQKSTVSVISNPSFFPIFKGSMTSNANVCGEFTVGGVTYKEFADDKTKELTFGMWVKISGEPQLYPNGLEQLSAKDFAKQCDYMRLELMVRAPQSFSYLATMDLVLNQTRKYTFESPRHYPSKAPCVIIPLNERARAAMSDYRMFNPKSGMLLHYNDMDSPNTGK
jgi:hypothetical protein